MSNNILTIPPELFDLVARFAQPCDLLALRLVCREASEKVHDVFRDVHFSTCAVLFSSEDSLRTLLSVARQELFFSRAVRKIIFCPNVVDDEADGSSYVPPPDIHECQKLAVAESDRLILLGLDLELLVQVFATFAQRGKVVEVQIANYPSDDQGRSKSDIPKPWNLTALETSCDQPLYESHTLEPDNNRISTMLLRALEQTQFPEQKLSILQYTWLPTFLRTAADNHPELSSALRCVLPKLTHLELALGWYGLDPEEQDIKRVDELVGLATSLQSLTIYNKMAYLKSEGQRRCVQRQTAFFNKYLCREIQTLHRLELDKALIDSETLFRFVKRNPKLRSLHLKSIILYCATAFGHSENGAWEQVRLGARRPAQTVFAGGHEC